MATTAATHDQPEIRETAAAPVNEIVRDIARGGLAGVMVGAVVLGLGGRLVMRFATILQEQAVGGLTDNGNRIGDITLGGTFALVLVGTFVGAMAGTIWVVVTPWLPRDGLRRAAVAVPLAIAIGTGGIIEGNTGDFIKLRHDPGIVVLFIVLVGLVGLLLSLIDDWLERRLPHPTPERPNVLGAYAVFVGLGAVLVLPIVVAGFLGSSKPEQVREGLALVVVGLATLAWWAMRMRGRDHPPSALVIVGRIGVIIAAVLGLIEAIPGIRGALGG